MNTRGRSRSARRLRHVIEGSAHVGDHRLALGGSADGIGGELDVSQRPVHVLRVDNEHGDTDCTKPLDGIRWRSAGSTGEHEVGAGIDDLLHVDAVEAAHDRHVCRLGRVIGDVLNLADDAVAGAEREQDLGLGWGEEHDLLRFGLEA